MDVNCAAVVASSVLFLEIVVAGDAVATIVVCEALSVAYEVVFVSPVPVSALVAADVAFVFVFPAFV